MRTILSAMPIPKGNSQTSCRFCAFFTGCGPSETTSMDLLRPPPLSKSGNKNAVVLTDFSTKYTIAMLLTNQTAKAAPEFFLKKVILRHSSSKRLTTDQGTHFWITCQQLSGSLRGQANETFCLPSQNERASRAKNVEHHRRTHHVRFGTPGWLR